MAKYIAEMDLSAFVMDYDHNSPCAEELRERHFEFYKTVRAAKPELPIIMLTMPLFTKEPNSDNVERTAIIRNNYERALAEGDKNVYFFDGYEYFPLHNMANLYAVDGLHSNDVGMSYMAKNFMKSLTTL